MYLAWLPFHEALWWLFQHTFRLETEQRHNPKIEKQIDKERYIPDLSR